jgi:prepilin signal peptidase PulO-like enzyme (type II secretory pathway)
LGVSKEQIKELVELKSKKKIDTVLVKEGIPFVPSFLVAFVIVLVLEYYGVNLIGLLFV